MATQLVRYLFTVDEYYKMAEVGIFHEDDRVELLEGEIVNMAAIGSRHAAGVDRLTRAFSRRLEGRAPSPGLYIVRVQNPVRLGERSEPQPDLALLRPRPDFYSNAHPTPGDVLLLVEVSQTSEEYDREIKMPLYARYGIVEVWLVDLSAEIIEIYRSPSPDGYADVRRVGRGESLSVQALPDVVLEVNEVLGAQ